jgi:hypothetical protein
VRDRLRTRLCELKDQFDQGQRKLAELEAQTAELRTTLLRISGAIQVLEEELGKGEGPAPADPSPGGPRP